MTFGNVLSQSKNFREGALPANIPAVRRPTSLQSC